MSERLTFTQADRDEIERETCQESLYEFFKAAWPILEPAQRLIDGWHLQRLCTHLEAVSRGDITRLAISIPPGFCKSMLVSVMWPTWSWTHSPHLRWLTSSSSEAFCERDAGKMRMLIGSDWYQRLWPTTFPSVDTVLRFVNSALGERLGKSWSSLTGVRGNVLVLDDLLPVDQANSETERQKVSRRFFESATSRLYNEHDAIVIIAQRVHEDDLIGELQQRQAKGEDLGFEFVNIPMEWEGAAEISSAAVIPIDQRRDPRTEIGELILPAYRSAKWVEREKSTMGAYAWNAQYQQEPTPRGNGFLRTDDFKFYEPGEQPKALSHYMTSDHALGLSATGDFNVVRIWGLDSKKNYYLIDSFRQRCSINRALGLSVEEGRFTILPTGAFALMKKYRPLAWFADGDHIIKAQQQTITDAMNATGVWTRREIIAQGRQNKMERASAFQVLSQLGKIYLPDNSIGRAALAEYEAFSSTCRWDDQVDADSILPRMVAHPAIIAPMSVERVRDDYVATAGDAGAMSDAHNSF